MSTQARPATASASPAARTKNRIDHYVDRQLDQTTRRIRFSEIATGIISLILFWFVFFSIASIVDAWVWPLSGPARWLALATLIIGSGAVIWLTLAPLLFRKINPDFAARIIEQSRPGFKNSLVNYLDLRRNGKGVHRAIVNEVSRRAATDLSAVSIDSAVDKSNLIRVGFMFVTLLALGAGYLLTSPRNPWTTVKRVLAPAARIARPSAVTISDVAPGDASVFFGDRLEVTANIRGTHDPSDVRLVYSTSDGQISDASVSMQPNGGSNYSALLETGPAGIQQPLTYRIEARDGISPDWSVEVRPNPAITISSIRIVPPPYTGLPERQIDGFGEVEAVEGADVFVEATANMPIEVAYLVPLISQNVDDQPEQFRELRTITMNSEGHQAHGHFVAALNSNRDRPLFTHYSVRFSSTTDFQNERPNVYPVRVIADLSPEVEIIQPNQPELIVPANQPFRVDIRASDPDYRISSVALQIDHQGTTILDRNLIADLSDQNATGVVRASLQLTAAELGLKPGDTAIMYATAADNRVSPSSKLPDPNISRTENYTLVVTEPIEQPQTPRQDSNDQQDQDEPSQQKPERSEADQQNSEGSGDPSDQSKGSGQSPSDSEAGSGDAGAEESNSDGKADSSNSGDDANREPTNEGESQSDPADQKPGQSGGTESGGDETDSDSPSGASGDEAESDGDGEETRNGEQSEPGQTEQQQNGNSSGDRQEDASGQRNDGSSAGGGSPRDSDSPEAGSSADAANDNDGGAASGQEFRDEDLEDGDSQPLGENAPEGDKIEKLKEYFDRREQSGSSDGEGRKSGQQLDDSRELDKPQDLSPSDDQESGTSENDQQTNPQSEAANIDESATIRDENPEPAEGGASESRKQDRVADRNSDQPTPSGRSQDGSPQPEAGSGTEQDAQAADETGPRAEAGGDSQSDSTEQQTGDQDSEQESPQDSETGETGAAAGSEATGSESGDDNSSKGSPSNSPGNEASDSSAGDTGQPGEPSANDSNSESNGSSDRRQPTQNAGSSSESAEPESGDSAQSQPADGQPNQPGRGGSSSASNSGDATDDTGSEQANLDYARKVTDLVLDKLADQQFEPDQELLDQMNWTRQDLEKFLASWQKMKENAKTGDAGQVRDYEQRLKALGLERETRGRTVKAKRDNPFQLNEKGAVEQIPPELAKPFKSYLKRRNRSKRNQRNR